MAILKYPQSYYDAGLDPDVTFIDPTNAYSDDGSDSVAETTKKNSSDYIEYYNFDMQIPTEAAISSVTLEVEWKCSTAASILDMACQLYRNGTAMGTAITCSSEPTSNTAQSTTDTGTWSASQLNGNTQNDLAARITVNRGDINTDGNVLWDYVKITVDYTSSSVTYKTVTTTFGILGKRNVVVKKHTDPF